jgi:hypothetical protein
VDQAFLELQKTTRCPFAKRAMVVAGPDWDYTLSFEENVAFHADAIRSFVSRIDPERLDGFAAKVGTESAVPSYAEVRRQFGRYLVALGETDESCRRAMESDFLAPQWQFTHSEVRFFLNVFAAFYPQPHSKYAGVRDGFFVFFQPERSFDFCAGPPLDVFKFEIRRRFTTVDMPYNGDLIDQRFEALLYMFPVEPYGEAVRWWDE